MALDLDLIQEREVAAILRQFDDLDKGRTGQIIIKDVSS